MRIGVVGYGTGGQHFHTPFIAAAKGGVCVAVTIITPPQTRRSLVLEAIAASLHVIADKPFAPDAAGAKELNKAAEAKGGKRCSDHTLAA